MTKRMRRAIRSGRRRGWHASRDAYLNLRFVRGDGRFLVVRHPDKMPQFYDVILRWLEEHAPGVRRRFELRLLPTRTRDVSRYALCVPWLQDPVQQWSARAYEQARRLCDACEAGGVPTINHVARLTNTGRYEAASRLAAAGLRVPWAVRAASVEQLRELPFPFLVREEWGHSIASALRRRHIVRCDGPDDLAGLDLAAFARPVAVEFIDTKDPRDGLYRKYRSWVAGDLVIPHHLQAQEHWFVKGEDQVVNAATMADDLAFLSRPDPHEAELRRAREALDLDVVAVDYSYDRAGRPVYWEANPYPYLHFLTKRLAYRSRAAERTIAAVIHLYHTRAGLAVPAEITRLLEYA